MPFANFHGHSTVDRGDGIAVKYAFTTHTGARGASNLLSPPIRGRAVISQHQAAIPGSSGQGLDMFREDELARLSGPERQMLAGLHGAGAIGGNLPPQPIGAPTSEAGVRGQLPSSNELSEDAEGNQNRNSLASRAPKTRAPANCGSRREAFHKLSPSARQEAAGSGSFPFLRLKARPFSACLPHLLGHVQCLHARRHWQPSEGPLGRP